MTSGVSQTQADTAVMEQTAARFEQVDQELHSMLSGLMAQLEVLQQAWRGAGGRSFEQVKQQWALDQRRLQEALRETAAAVRTSGQGYGTTDMAASERVSRANRPIELPL